MAQSDDGWARGRGLVGHPLVRGAAVAITGYLVLQLVWPTPAGVVIQGVIVGALTAMIAFGIALIYRSNKVINFAQADLGLVPASVAIMLIVPRSAVGGVGGARMSYWLAMPLALVAALLLGSLVERVIIRRFAKAPRLILAVATIGLSQVLAGVAAVVPAAFGTLFAPQRYPSPFDFSFEIRPIVFHGNDLLAVIFSAVAIGGLMGFLRYTSIGMAIRASAESADRASLLGINVGRTQNVAWALATVLSTIAMILRGGIIGLPIGAAIGPSVLLRALAAAVIGRMENFGVMFGAACGLGILETAIIWNEGNGTLVDPVIFMVLIAALLVQRRRRESRTEDQAISSWQNIDQIRPIPRELRSLPEVRWVGVGLGALGALLVLALPLVLDDGHTNLAAAVWIYAMVAVSLVVLTGWAGEVSLGQVAFVGIGAAVAGALNVHFRWDLLLTTIAAATVGGVASIVVGLPALRIRGLFLAVTTMSFALATSSYLLNRKYFGYLPDNVSERVTRFPLLGRADISSETAFYYVCLGALVLVLWAVRGLRRSRTARVLIATRENERGAQAFGINLTRTKLMAFGLSGFIASFAGGLFAVHQQAVGQDIFAPVESIRALSMVVVGGLGSVPGAILGAVFLKSTEWFNGLVPGKFRVLFSFAGSGVGLMVVLLFLPGGLGGLLYRVRDRYLRAVATRRGIDVPSLIADGGERATTEQRATVRERLRAKVTGFLPRRSTTAAAPSDVLLRIRGLDLAYGPVQVLFGVDLDVREGEIIALLGTNGAGKSTVLRAISGLAPPRAGSIELDGVDITGVPAHRIAAMGITQVPGGRGIFPSLTVAENLRVAGWMFRRDASHVSEATARVLETFPILGEKLDQPAATMSGGQQQMLTLGMAFISRPRLLMIDELSLGLAPVIVEQLLEVVEELRAQGTTIILVEQSVNVALTVAQTAYFMEKGEVKFHGPTSELLERPDVLRSVYLQGAGGGATTPARNGRRRKPTGADASPSVILETTGLSKSFSGVRAVDDVSFRLHDGEILGIIGPNGAGKTTVFDLISGFLVPDEGTVVFDGHEVTSLRPDERSLLGLARSFQDARLFGGLTVHDAIALALDRQLDVRDPVAAALNLPDVWEAEQSMVMRVDELIELMGLGSFRDKFISELSTGSRRIVDLACLVGLEPRVILFDEPSSGIAQREAEALGPVLLRIREQTGASLLVIEHDMPLLTTISDRLLALDLGRVVLDGDSSTVLNDAHVVASYLGSTRAVIERSGDTKPTSRTLVATSPKAQR
jgi:ABC-type branched-subunit amino acid transport system ATPase component/ABC-type branched-subunit amino acid transport system permease subunit